MMNLKQYLKNVLFVTILEKNKNCGTDGQVVKFGCMKTVVGGTLLMVTCVTFASRWLNFPKTSYINTIQYWIFFVTETLIFVVWFNYL
jgi:hypothetical protein